LLFDIGNNYNKIAARPIKIIGGNRELSTRKIRWRKRKADIPMLKMLPYGFLVISLMVISAQPAQAYDERAQYNIHPGEQLDPAAQTPTTDIPPTRTTYGYITLPDGRPYPYIGPQEKMIPTRVLQPGEHPENWKAPMPHAGPLPGISGQRIAENPELDALRESQQMRLELPYPGKPGTNTTVTIPRGILKPTD
jgi:hypothetical protein